MTVQVAVRVSEGTLRSIDDLIRNGTFANRTEAIRAALDLLVDQAERRDLEARITAGYRRFADAPSDPWLDAATRALVSAEPW